jgi:hypothetical protein
MLTFFAVLGVIGVLLLSLSVVIGLAFLVAAEAFFFVAYRRFSKRP